MTDGTTHRYNRDRMNASTAIDGNLALTAIFSEVAAGRRVLWIGDAGSAGVERLGEVALDLNVIDTSGRGAGRTRVIQFDATRPLGLEGTFDLALVPDAVALDDLSQRLAEVREVLGDGVLILGVDRSRDDLEGLRTSLRSSYREVRELGQGAFVGAAFADLTAPPETVAVDGSLVRAEPVEVDRYVFVAADELPDLDSLVLVQLPSKAPVKADESEAFVVALRDELARSSSRLEHAQVRLVETEAELAKARARLAAPKKSPALKREPVDERWAEELGEAEERLRNVSAELREARAESERRGVLVRDLNEELREWCAGHRHVERRALASAGTSEDVDIALDAEAALAAAEFTIDELRAQLAERAAVKDEGPRVRELEGENAGLRMRLRDLQASAEKLRKRPADDGRVRELEGECAGLRLRIGEMESAFEKATSQPAASAEDPQRVALQAEVEELRRTNSELTIATVDLAAERDALEERGRDASSALAARDALVTRLQLDLAQEENARALVEARQKRLVDETRSLREAVVDASMAVGRMERAEAALDALRAEREEEKTGKAADEGLRARVEELEGALEEATKERDGARAENESLKTRHVEAQDAQKAAETRASEIEDREAEQRTALEDAKGEVERLRSGLLAARKALTAMELAGARGGAVSASITAVGEPAPRLSEDSGQDTLLRSLTAQLEERDDRIRALSRRLEGKGEGDQTDALELQERVERLNDALSHERSAREAADARVVELLKDSRRSGSEAELGAELARRETELSAARERRDNLEMDVQSLRGVCDETRKGLESLLADADADEEAARRIGSLLDVLRGY